MRARGDEALREYTRRYDGAELAELAVSDAEFAAAGATLAPAQAEAIARAIDTVTRFHAGADRRPDPRRNRTGRRLRTDRRADPCGRSVRARGHRPAALHRDHAGRPGAARRVPAANHVHSSAQRRDRRSGRADRGARLRRHRDLQGGRRAGDCRARLRHRSPCRVSTRSSVRATPGSPQPSSSFPPTRQVPRSTCRPARPRSW